ncbi:RNA pseudouridine synthase 5 isoform X2 [Triticum urartu]|uniref:RNA pseudouridine synthase 5 isoform X2 n=1 Tax=Triticum urartu TaxID=4572 RepID=UPI0020439A47|nr:RNA pseudouridine synthase 5 isoform X2 [Triticum urartu]
MARSQRRTLLHRYVPRRRCGNHRRLDQLLLRELQELGAIARITVDGQVVTDPDMILRVGSKLVYHRLAWKEPFAPHLLQVLYEDDDMVALNKPSGLQVLPKGIFQQRTVLAQLQWKEWKMPPSSCSKRKNVQLHPVPVHRLGRGTSGLLLCAKTKLAKVQLASYFAEGAANAEKKRDGTEVGKERKISKFYRALVTGILEHNEDVVTQPIGLVHYPGVAEGLYVACSSGKPAMSKVCVLERLVHQNQTLVQVEIHSGRPHQIRIHLAYIGHPLVEVMRGLYSLFPETVGITCMLIGWSFLIQPRISDCVCGGKWPDVQQVTSDLHEDMVMGVVESHLQNDSSVLSVHEEASFCIIYKKGRKKIPINGEKQRKINTAYFCRCNYSRARNISIFSI